MCRDTWNDNFEGEELESLAVAELFSKVNPPTKWKESKFSWAERSGKARLKREKLNLVGEKEVEKPD